LASDYVPPPHNWFPSFNAVLDANARVYIPAIGGKLLYLDDVDFDGARTLQLNYRAFYGNVGAAQSELDASLMISTPLLIDKAGDVFFGFYTTAANSVGISSGVARVAADGTGTWQAASTLASDASIDRVAMNSAPALSADESTLYVAVSNAQTRGYLISLNSTTLAMQARIALTDPSTGTPARISGDSTASPTVGPDGDVYFGVLESNSGAHNARGWLLHFDGTLTQTKIPGSFGWDDTATVVAAAHVPAYSGTSTYLLATKYNNYAGAGSGDGQNRMAILDPNTAQTDSIAGIPVMKEVITVLGPTPDADNPGGVREWCVNTAAFDPFTHSMLVNNEDGYMYRWDLATNTLSQKIQFNNGLGQSYTPTAVGADGTIYAINNAILFAIGQ
jgi:hypothetical protein